MWKMLKADREGGGRVEITERKLTYTEIIEIFSDFKYFHSENLFFF